MKERELTKQIRDLLKACGIFHWKAWQGLGSTKGVADIVGCLSGKMFAIEVKTATGRLSEYQRSFLRQLERAGGIACVARSPEDVVEALGLRVKLYPLFEEKRKGVIS